MKSSWIPRAWDVLGGLYIFSGTIFDSEYLDSVYCYVYMQFIMDFHWSLLVCKWKIIDKKEMKNEIKMLKLQKTKNRKNKTNQAGLEIPDRLWSICSNILEVCYNMEMLLQNNFHKIPLAYQSYNK